MNATRKIMEVAAIKQTEPIYRQIESYVGELINANRHITDYMLPSENKLAGKFKSSRVTVQKALNNMQDAGKIIRIQGKGTFINHEETASAAEDINTLYLLLPDIERYYSREVINGAYDFFKQKGITLSIAMTDNDPDVENTIIRTVISQRCQGIILFPVIHLTYQKVLLELAISNYPIVLVGNNLPGINFSSVHCDYYKQIYNTVSLLIRKGHRNIGYISEMSKDSTTYKERIRAYTDCIAEHFNVKSARYIEADFYPDKHRPVNNAAIEAAIHKFLWDNPGITALITTDMALEYILRYIDRSGQHVNNLCFVVIDGPEYRDMVKNKDVMVINQNPRIIGQKAAEQLYNQLKNNAAPREIITEDEIVNFE